MKINISSITLINVLYLKLKNLKNLKFESYDFILRGKKVFIQRFNKFTKQLKK